MPLLKTTALNCREVWHPQNICISAVGTIEEVMKLVMFLLIRKGWITMSLVCKVLDSYIIQI